MRYRAALVVLIALALGLVGAPSSSLAGPRHRRPSPLHQLARDGRLICARVPTKHGPVVRRSCYALQRALAHPHGSLLVWSLAEVVRACLDATVYTSGPVRTRYVRSSFSNIMRYTIRGNLSRGVFPRPHRGRVRFYDAAEWIGQDLMSMYRFTHDARYLRSAKQLLAFERKGQSPKGGIYWNTTRQTRNTVSTAGTAVVALEVYRATHDLAALRFARKLYRWERANLENRKGLYGDHINKHGRVDRSIYTYNQGLMIESGLQLYQETKNRTYLKQATVTANAAVAKFGIRELELHPVFDAIYFEDLLDLNRVAPNPAYLKSLKMWAAHILSRTSHATGVFHNRTRHGDTPAVQAAAMQILLMRMTR